MSPELLAVIAVIAATIILTSVFTARRAFRRKGSQKEEAAISVADSEQSEISKAAAEEAERVSIHAEVIDMACEVVSVGYQSYRQPRAERRFFIKFKAESGEIFDLRVSESVYEGFEVGLVGKLTLIDGQLDSFEIQV